MRKIDALANEKYDGDVIKAMCALIDSEQDCREYHDELTIDERRILMKYFINKYATEKYGSRKNFSKAISFEIKLKSLGITEKDLENAKGNPYGKEIKKGVLYLVLSCIAFALILIFREPLKDFNEWIGLFVYAALFISLSVLAGGIINYCKFNSLLKMYRQIQETKKQD